MDSVYYITNQTVLSQTFRITIQWISFISKDSRVLCIFPPKFLLLLTLPSTIPWASAVLGIPFQYQFWKICYFSSSSNVKIILTFFLPFNNSTHNRNINRFHNLQRGIVNQNKIKFTVSG